MGLRSALGLFAAAGAHVFVVETPGSWRTRMAVERCARSLGWPIATSPAASDILVVCGQPGREMAVLVEQLWDQLPGPRARVRLDSPDEVEAVLAGGAARLRDTSAQLDDARARAVEPLTATDHEGHEGHGDGMAGHEGHEGHGGGGGMAGHEGHEGHGGGGGMAGHEGHEGHGGGMAGHEGHGAMAPAGIPLAQGGDDRDGLEMDQLHVRLGPVLAHWPAGLVLRCTLQGDVIGNAEASTVDGHTFGVPRRYATPAEYAARRCDAALDVLALAGWRDGAARARRARDVLLDGDDLARASAELRNLRRVIARSRTLRWVLRGQGVLDVALLQETGLPDGLRGDSHDRLLSIVDRAATALEANSAPLSPGAAAEPLHTLPRIVKGLDVATGRLVVASLDLDDLRRAPEEVSVG